MSRHILVGNWEGAARDLAPGRVTLQATTRVSLDKDKPTA